MFKSTKQLDWHRSTTNDGELSKIYTHVICDTEKHTETVMIYQLILSEKQKDLKVLKSYKGVNLYLRSFSIRMESLFCITQNAFKQLSIIRNEKN